MLHKYFLKSKKNAFNIRFMHNNKFPLPNTSRRTNTEIETIFRNAAQQQAQNHQAIEVAREEVAEINTNLRLVLRENLGGSIRERTYNHSTLASSLSLEENPVSSPRALHEDILTTMNRNVELGTLVRVETGVPIGSLTETVINTLHNVSQQPPRHGILDIPATEAQAEIRINQGNYEMFVPPYDTEYQGRPAQEIFARGPVDTAEFYMPIARTILTRPHLGAPIVEYDDLTVVREVQGLPGSVPSVSLDRSSIPYYQENRQRFVLEGPGVNSGYFRVRGQPGVIHTRPVSPDVSPLLTTESNVVPNLGYHTGDVFELGASVSGRISALFFSPLNLINYVVNTPRHRSVALSLGYPHGDALRNPIYEAILRDQRNALTVRNNLFPAYSEFLTLLYRLPNFVGDISFAQMQRVITQLYSSFSIETISTLLTFITVSNSGFSIFFFIFYRLFRGTIMEYLQTLNYTQIRALFFSALTAVFPQFEVVMVNLSENVLIRTILTHPITVRSFNIIRGALNSVRLTVGGFYNYTNRFPRLRLFIDNVITPAIASTVVRRTVAEPAYENFVAPAIAAAMLVYRRERGTYVDEDLIAFLTLFQDMLY